VPLNDTSKRVFQELVTAARAKGYSHIFTNPRTGRPYAYLYHGWQKACRLAGIENLRIHDLRHTFGTRAADDGAPLNAIQAVMGHKSIATTMKYTHATDEGRRRVVRSAERKPGKVVKIWSKVS
jgi:integrase